MEELKKDKALHVFEICLGEGREDTHPTLKIRNTEQSSYVRIFNPFTDLLN
jgi:hypothetical protein